MQRRRERRTILLAIIASLLLHFAVAISLAAFGGKLQPPVPEEDKPVQLTFVDSTPTPSPQVANVPKNAPMIETPQSRETKEAPTEKTFESNANSIAASEQPAQANGPVPTQDGKDRGDLELEAQRYSLALADRQPHPESSSSKSTPTPPPTPVPTATATPRPQPTATATPAEEPTPEERLAMLRATPPPPLSTAEESTPSPTPEAATPPQVTRPKPLEQQPPPSSYRREQVPTRMSGNISNRGVASVNAIGTPLGRYSKEVHDAIGSRWYSLVKENGDRVNIGTVQVGFSVDRRGRITNIRLISNTSDESFCNLCLQSLQEAKVPPMAEDIAGALPPEGMQEQLTFTIYPN